jgi:short-subunit dehydrogenase
MQRTGKTAVVTGASAGLGVHFARLLAQDGHDVVLVARRRGKLEEVAGELRATSATNPTVVVADLGDPQAWRRISDVTTQAAAEVHYLVNNAGFGTSGEFVALDIERELQIVDVNIKAMMRLTGLFLPAMVARGSGRILNIASGAGFVPGPYMATYYASKAFMVSFTEALACELRGTGVTATVSCPPATATEFAAVAGAQSSALFRGMADPAKVAVHSYRAMMAGQTIAIPGMKNKLSVQSLRLSPRSMARAVAARMNRP